jgi:hypothetical protein
MRSIVCATVLALAAPAFAEPRPAPLKATEDDRTARMHRKIGIGFLAGAVTATALGGLFVGLAKNANDDALANNVYDPSAVDRRNAFQTLEAVTFGLGVGCLATGLVFYFDR